VAGGARSRGLANGSPLRDRGRSIRIAAGRGQSLDGQYWAMAFVHDQWANGRKFRVLRAIIEKWHRQCVALEAGFSLTGQSVVDAMNEIARSWPLRHAITVDLGTEFMSRVLDEWC
jgi:hypothetical protein